MSPPKNIAASVHRRLLNRARQERRTFNELLQSYANERFLYRLFRSKHARRFILKGALLIRAWQSSDLRPTMDIDMLGQSENEEAVIRAQIREILLVEVEPDGLEFDPDSIRTERIIENAGYAGIRVRFKGKLGNAQINMQIDIGFGDVIYPRPVKKNFPTLLDAPPPQILCYSLESTIAEKFEVIVKYGSLNSRMKDFYDLWFLSRHFDFYGHQLSEAIRLTFEKRGTPLSLPTEAFHEPFISVKQTQWTSFLYRIQTPSDVPREFKIIVSQVKSFLEPVVSFLISGNPELTLWRAPGPWK